MSEPKLIAHDYNGDFEVARLFEVVYITKLTENLNNINNNSYTE